MKRNERPTSAMEADSGNSNVRGFVTIPLSKALELSTKVQCGLGNMRSAVDS